MFLIKAVRVDVRDRVDAVLWQAADPRTNRNVGPEHVVRVADVVSEVKRDGYVGTWYAPVFGAVSQGPWVKVVVDADAREWIETDNTPNDGRTLFDLPRLPPMTKAHDEV